MEGPFIGAFKDIDKAATEAMWHIDAKAEENGWDAPPVLLTIKIKPLLELDESGAMLSALDVALFTGWMAVVEKYEDPKDMLSFMAYVTSRFPKKMRAQLFDLEHLYGLAFVSETWTVHTHLKDEKAIKKLEKKIRSDDHAISKMADRVESRMVFLVSMDGNMTALMHERDGIPEVMAPDEDKKIAGAIPDLMSHLIKVMKT